MDNEQLLTQNIQQEPPKNSHIAEDVAEGALNVGIDVASEAIGEALENADDLPAIAIIGIIAGVLAVIGGIAFVICKIVKSCKKK